MSAGEFARSDGKRPIALYTSKLGGGGVEMATIGLAYRLAGRGWPVDLVVDEAKGELAQEVADPIRLVELQPRGWLAGLRRVMQAGKGGRWAFLRQAPKRVMAVNRLATYLEQVRPQGLLAANGRCNMPAIAARDATSAATSVVVSERNPPSIDRKRARPRRRQVCPQRRAWYPRADAVVAVSRCVGEDLCRFAQLDRTRVKVVYNGVDVSAVARGMVGEEPHPWLAERDAPVIVSLGRLAPQKDQATLLKAFARLREQRPAQLILFGEGPERQRLERQARKLGIAEAVAMPGYTPGPHAAMARAAVLALSSRWEGCPNVLLEALACGCQIVATDCHCGPRELLGQGYFGQLVPVGDPENLAAGLGEALDRRANQLRGYAVNHDRQAWLARFSPDETANSYLALMGLPPRPPRAAPEPA